MSQDAPSLRSPRRLRKRKRGDHDHSSTVLGGGSIPASIEHGLTAEEPDEQYPTSNELVRPGERCAKLIVPQNTGKQLCSICRNIRLSVGTVQTLRGSCSVKLGSIKDILKRSHCPLCRVVFDISLKNPKIRSIALDTESQARQTYVLKRDVHNMQAWRKSTFWIDYGGKTQGYITASTNPSSFRTGPAELDVDIVKSWLKECDEHHPNCNTKSWMDRCSEPFELSLIDVIEHRIIPARSDYRYLTLSYVRGAVEMFQCIKDNELDLQQHGALLTRRDDIAPVIQDAIELVSALGERYLWVDCLCIVQDDEKQKHHQIAQMDVIYSQAFLTIAALSGTNAHARLPGLRPKSRMPIRTMEAAEVVNFSTPWLGPSEVRSTLYFRSVPRGLGSVISSVPYETRGWTFQERLLSRRCLYITDHQIYFQCRSGYHSEAEGCSDSNELMARLEDLQLSGFVRFPHEVEIVDTYRRQFDAALSSGPSHLKELCSKLKSEGYKSQALNTIERLVVEDSGFEKFLNPLLKVPWRPFIDSSNYHTAFEPYSRLIPRYTRRELSFPTDILNAFSGVASALGREWNTSFAYGLPEAFMDIALLWVPAGPVSRRLIPAVCGLQSIVRFPSWSWAGWVGAVKYSITQLTQGLITNRLKITSEIKNVFLEEQSSLRPINKIEPDPLDEEVACADTKREPSPVRVLTSVSGVLHFEAFGTTVQNFVIPGVLATDPESRKFMTLIRDTQGRCCGILFDTGSLLSTNLQNRSYHFILLSRSHGWFSPFKDRLCPLACDGICFMSDTGVETVMNVMLIEWKGEVAERLAVGAMSVGAWQGACSESKYIRLA